MTEIERLFEVVEARENFDRQLALRMRVRNEQRRESVPDIPPKL
jgi:hypothetical protein